MMLSETALSKEDMSAAQTSEQALLDGLRSRITAVPRALIDPGPTERELEIIVSAALFAFDTDEIRPWRLISISAKAMDGLAELLMHAKARRVLGSVSESHESDRAMKWHAPAQIAVVVRLDPEGHDAPLRDQYLAVGAAIQNLLLSAHALGYGATLSTGDEMRDTDIVKALGIGWNEKLIGFVSFGTCPEPARPRYRPKLKDYLTNWPGPEPAAKNR
ncbi:MAG: nitroreductase family protein [Methyloligellaceae bacterium]